MKARNVIQPDVLFSIFTIDHLLKLLIQKRSETCSDLNLINERVWLSINYLSNAVTLANSLKKIALISNVTYERITNHEHGVHLRQ